MSGEKQAAAAWLKAQSARGRRAAAPVVGLALLGTLLAIGQAWCAASLLTIALGDRSRPIGWLLAVFALAALLRAGLGVLGERAAQRAGAAARARLRDDALARLLAAGPALLRQSHSGALGLVLVDRIEALEGLFARWLPASMLALAAPALVLLAALVVDPFSAAVLLGAGLLVPLAMALSGIGAARAARRQFVALARLQARFLDRVRGIATIVLLGRAEDEAGALARAADELRRRTLRVLRMAFLSSAALDLAMAGAIVVLALHFGFALAGGRMVRPAAALFTLLLVPEFFAPLRAFAAAYQDRMQAIGAAEALLTLPTAPAPAPAPAPPPPGGAGGPRLAPGGRPAPSTTSAFACAPARR
jgi:ATP-binding cassette subfamily C protein CydD